MSTLEAADYAFLSVKDIPIGIERSEINNLVQKLRSGELEEQLRKCDNSYGIVYLLVEGVYDHVGGLLAVYKGSDRGYFRIRVYPATYYDHIVALLVRLEELGVRVVFSPNLECSMMVIKAIYQQMTKVEDQHNLFKKIRPLKIPVKLSSNPAIPKLLALCSRMGEKTAIRLIYRFGDIWSILCASDEELLGVEGMGKSLVLKLKASVGKE